MRYLGIDYGLARVGMALSDEGGSIAFPYDVLSVKNIWSTAKEILRVVKEKDVGMIVVGMPRSMGGKETEQTRITKEFVDFLADYVSVPVETCDEVLTTKIARTHSTPEMLDASAAALILQGYLDGNEKRKAKNEK